MIKLVKQVYLFLWSKTSSLKTDPLYHIPDDNLPLNGRRGETFEGSTSRAQ